MVWICRCDCGQLSEVATDSLRQRRQYAETADKDCGCPRGQRKRPSAHPLYNSWITRRQRAKRDGVSVCERWQGKDGFDHFIADMGERPDGCRLYRVDPDGGFEPDNCRWAKSAPTRRRRNTPRQRVFSVRIAADQRARLDELAADHDGKISTVIKIGITIADQTVRITELLESGATMDDPRLKAALAAQEQAFDALLAPIRKKKPRQDSQDPDGAETSMPLVGEEVGTD